MLRIVPVHDAFNFRSWQRPRTVSTTGIASPPKQYFAFCILRIPATTGFDLLQRAIDLDPDYIAAHAYFANFSDAGSPEEI
jgi:hypothetical protein